MMRLGFKAWLSDAFHTIRYASRHYKPWHPHFVDGTTQHESREIIIERCERIIRSTTQSVRVKGHPDIGAIRSMFARQLRDDLIGATPRAVESARTAASLDMGDSEAFQLFCVTFEMLNRQALVAARKTLAPFVILHMSCLPRLERATESAASFRFSSAEVSNIYVVGFGHVGEFTFDATRMMLTVPEDDGYAGLAGKVIAAFTFLRLCSQVKVVLKVDDDHRLANLENLELLFSRAWSCKFAAAFGEVVNAVTLGAHNRVWHFGKTGQDMLSCRPYTMAGTSRFVAGSAGYLINRPAMDLLFWSYVYFRDQIAAGLYEDQTVSDLLERQGGRLIDVDMARAVSAVTSY